MLVKNHIISFINNCKCDKYNKWQCSLTISWRYEAGNCQTTLQLIGTQI